LDLIDPPLRDVVVILVKPTSLDVERIGHLVQVLNTVWLTDEMPVIITVVGQFFFLYRTHASHPHRMKNIPRAM
jgi:hypothetical protein